MKKNKYLINIAKRFSNKRIAVIGDLILDSYAYGHINKLNPESAAPLLTLVSENKDFRLGGAGNVATNLLNLGAIVDLYGVLGNDFRGRKFEKIIKTTGINLIKLYEGQTIEKKRFIELSHGHYLIRIDSGESNLKEMSLKGENILFEQIKKSMHSYDGLILSDYNKKLFRSNFGQKIIDLANLNNKLIVVDPKPVNAKKFLKARVVRPNLSEAKEIIGKKDLPLNALASELKKQMQSKSVVITCGGKGMIAFDEKFYHIPTKAREVVDVSGAGDTVGAVLLLSLASGADLLQAAQIANYAAGVVVEKQGTSTLVMEELINKITNDS